MYAYALPDLARELLPENFYTRFSGYRHHFSGSPYINIITMSVSRIKTILQKVIAIMGLYYYVTYRLAKDVTRLATIFIYFFYIIEEHNIKNISITYLQFSLHQFAQKSVIQVIIFYQYVCTFFYF